MNVVEAEAESLRRLAESLDSRFPVAVTAILETSGRVVVSGVGKSGHIARKIAGTLASTGTPSHYVHPVEASHGDLGKIVKGDSVLVISNSGETVELADLVTHCRNISVPLICITGAPQSTLARVSNVSIALPAMNEACGYTNVPTVSSVMALAAGDALAVAVMYARGCSPLTLRGLHPGGRLGGRVGLELLNPS